MTEAAGRLAGRGVAVTRAEGPQGALSRRLAAAGARVACWSSIAIEPPADPAPLAAALERLASFDWIVLTSANAAGAVVARLAAPPAGVRVAAVGAGTAAELTAAGWRVDLTGAGPGAIELVAALRAAGLGAGSRVLFPAGDRARATLADGLLEAGAGVERVEAYRTLSLAVDAAACAAQVDRGEVEAVTFASPSAAEALARALGLNRFRHLLARLAVASIGPTTSAALAALGRPADAEASIATFDGLVAATGAALVSRIPTVAGGSPR
jgi:uroporphyrinogen-III synthase